MNALRTQGYLTQDDRGHGNGGYGRLRFRLCGRVRSVYLGRDERLREQVRQELNLLQQEQRQRRRIAALTSAGKHSLRAVKRRLEPLLAQLGFHYHGNALRQVRRVRFVAESKSNHSISERSV